jgi:hypothetical protein
MIRRPDSAVIETVKREATMEVKDAEPVVKVVGQCSADDPVSVSIVAPVCRPDDLSGTELVATDVGRHWASCWPRPAETVPPVERQR